ncbi:hypothetical protein ASPZODRAFT_137221 [Penicilliopsis zonata CBS 506.65]|uniref:D-lactate dehydratase n=1 Tax=Penicilliopsis zonata CBS 506.65 TaxID=1073090 RepID=A0A1L9S654_9EURO|nr:hypothetical protein ASPZODRAFT_137221 [Penicilliopsis zonata CBS 506.65]OJJ42613.1 hypothetical protein ASPZODRAFT_137221 [Penicilliopsis zonata CBS 506.65]
MVIASPAGGAAPLDASSVEAFANDAVSASFLKEQESLWKQTVKLSAVDEKDFDAIFYVGGHGPMFDLYSDETSLQLIRSFAEAKKPVAAVCHGPAVLLKATSTSGTPLIENATVTGFSNVEEEQAGLTAAMPYLLESELQRVSGGGYVKADAPWGEKVVVSRTSLGGVLITGQNPASATGVGKAILEEITK